MASNNEILAQSPCCFNRVMLTLSRCDSRDRQEKVLLFVGVRKRLDIDTFVDCPSPRQFRKLLALALGDRVEIQALGICQLSVKLKISSHRACHGGSQHRDPWFSCPSHQVSGEASQE